MTELARWFERSAYSQREIADQLGITEGHMSRLVTGDRQPSGKLAVRISELTGIPERSLLRDVA
jgi:transcriptional regulator with XRE-family HTH domain